MAIGLLLPAELVHTPAPAVASAADRADMLGSTPALSAAAALRAAAEARAAATPATLASGADGSATASATGGGAADPPGLLPTDSEGGSTASLPVTDYTVQPGDTLTGIAARFGTDVPSLEASNDLNDSSVLQPGQRLVVPTQVGWVYSIAAGDTLEQIAAQVGVSADTIAAANHITGSTILQIGQRLWIPHDPPVSGMSRTRSGSGASAGGGGGSSSGGAVRGGGGGVGQLQWPVHGIITSPFGWRILYGRSDFHDGVDIAVPSGTPVHAAMSGRVITAGWDGPYGIAVRIQAGDVITMYAHNSRVAVSVGQYVGAGQVIAYSGMTGNATGPHVHFGVYINGQAVNPLQYLP
jgi:murein DD-endopeptidase MepM/ murein hydrolase activator NlpD